MTASISEIPNEIFLVPDISHLFDERLFRNSRFLKKFKRLIGGLLT
jgi:hypothetical protein